MRGLWSVVLEVFREMFELDSRLFRTLKSLLFKPGHLSSEFSRNRRAAYMSPVRLYLFISFVFFLVLSISAGGWLRNLDLSDADVQMGGSGDDPAAADSALAVTDSVLAAVDSALADRGLPAGLGLGAFVDSVLADSTLTADTRADSAVGQAIDPVQLEALKARLLPEHARKVDDILGRPGNPPAKQVVRGLAGSVDPDERASGVPAWLIRYGRGLLIDLFHDPRAFLQEAIGNLPIAMFFLLPVFAMILGVCYLRRKRFFVEHLVFGMHIHTFVFLMATTALLVPGEGAGNWVQLFLVVVSPLYVLIAMRRFYGEGWGRTLVKGFVVWNLYSFVLFPGLALALFIRT
ncbi:MAG: DUF3667 domain-containing protein [Gammaproteobacteria bacterium]|nr:DUF3667 domain-containing protein [Gammaproteobacteria bacterium]